MVSRFLRVAALSVGLLLPAALSASSAAAADPALSASPATAAAPATDGSGWKTLGLSTPVLDLPAGRQMVEALKGGGTGEQEALVYAQSYVASGATAPQAVELPDGQALQKIVPRGSVPSAYTGYWAMPSVMAAELAVPGQLTQRFALPPVQAAAAAFDVYQIAATRPVVVFQSTIAPTLDSQTGQTQTGGAEQTLVMNRALFTSPEKVGTVTVK